MSRKISDVLQQKIAFHSTHHEATVGLMLAYNQINTKQENFFKPFGLTPKQFNLLRILRGQYPNACNMFTIQERMINKKSDVSRLVERLRDAGLLTRDTSGDDRRAVDISITPKGLQLLEQIDPKMNEIEELNSLSEKEAQQLIKLIEKILI